MTQEYEPEVKVTKWRKKPVVIEAVRYSRAASRTNARALRLWIEANEGRASVHVTGDEVFLDVHTLEGIMRAKVGDWIIKGVKGEFYPCAPDVFFASYDAVEEPI